MICINCKKEFRLNGGYRWCSIRCKRIYKNLPFNCLKCGEELTYQKQFCSKHCSCSVNGAVKTEKGRKNISISNKTRKLKPRSVESRKRSSINIINSEKWQKSQKSEEIRQKRRDAQLKRKEKLGYINSEDAREKLRQNAKINPNYGMKGKHHSGEFLKRARRRALEDGQFERIGNNEKEILDKQEIIDQIPIYRQYYIYKLGLKVDGYNPFVNTVYEVYEKWHKRNIEHDLKRQKEIEECLGCKFVIIWDE